MGMTALITIGKIYIETVEYVMLSAGNVVTDDFGKTSQSILKLMPLDTYSDYQAILMEVVKGDDTKPIIWDEYKKIIADNFDKPNIKEMERQEFYKYSHKCFAIIQTGETALYGNLILKKGVI